MYQNENLFHPIFFLPFLEKFWSLKHQVAVAVDEDLHRVSCCRQLIGFQIKNFVVEDNLGGVGRTESDDHPCLMLVLERLFVVEFQLHQRGIVAVAVNPQIFQMVLPAKLFASILEILQRDNA